MSSTYLFVVNNLYFPLDEIPFKCSSETSYFFGNLVVCDKILWHAMKEESQILFRYKS